MRVAIITAWYPSKKNPLYGVFIQNQVKALSAQCSVYVLLLKWSIIPYSKERNEGDLTIIEKGGFYFPNLSERFLNFWAHKYYKFFKSCHAKYNFDLIHCHDHYGAFVGDKIKNDLSIPYLCTIHNSNIMNDKLVKWKQAYLPRILSNANTVIAVGEKLAQKLKSKHVRGEVKVIPNYIDTNLFSINADKNDKDFRFLFVGGLEPHKGVIEMVKAFRKAELKDATLHLVGSGILKNEIDSYIEDHNLSDFIHLYGELPNHKLPEIYNKSNVYISVSEYETFGITVLEAMACGLPILYTASGGPNELVEDFAGLEIKERSIDAISEGMKSIKDQFKNFDASAIRAHVINHYSSQKVIESLMNEYKLVLDAKA